MQKQNKQARRQTTPGRQLCHQTNTRRGPNSGRFRTQAVSYRPALIASVLLVGTSLVGAILAFATQAAGHDSALAASTAQPSDQAFSQLAHRLRLDEDLLAAIRQGIYNTALRNAALSGSHASTDHAGAKSMQSIASGNHLPGNQLPNNSLPGNKVRATAATQVASEITLSYDANGNLIDDGEQFTFEYDPAD